MDFGESVHANSAPVAASTTVRRPASPLRRNRTPQPSRPRRHRRRLKQHHPPRPRHPRVHPNTARRLDSAAWHFQQSENAAHLVAGLKSHGFSASIAEATKSGHKLYRVRVGAERDRAAARNCWPASGLPARRVGRSSPDENHEPAT